MSDIIERLRHFCTDWDGSAMDDQTEPMPGLHCIELREAAAEIARLRAVMEALRGLLRAIPTDSDMAEGMPADQIKELCDAYDKARASIAAADDAQAAPVGEPALWQFRWTNPGNDPDADEDAVAWREVKVSNPYMQTMADRLAELRSFTFNGKPCYEVRALYPQAAPVAPAEPAPPGWQLVPVEPTQEMVRALADNVSLMNFERGSRIGYAAMLAAAPHPPAPTSDTST